MVTEYERPSAEIIFDRSEAGNDDVSILIRASAALSCSRQLWYSGTDTAKTDEVPPSNRIRMDLGTRLESFVLEQMSTYHGWEIVPLKPKDPIYTMVDDELNLFVSGIPDALGYNKMTGPALSLIEVKTRDDSNFKQCVTRGAALSHPGAVAQMGFYRRMLVEKDVIEADADSVLVTMNRDTCEIDFQWFRPENLEASAESCHDYLKNVIRQWDTDNPNRLEPGSYQCKSCEWRTLCGNLDNEEPKGHVFEEVSEKDAMEALFKWEEEKANDLNVNRSTMSYARGVLLNHLMGQGIGQIQDAGKEWGL